MRSGGLGTVVGVGRFSIIGSIRGEEVWVYVGFSCGVSISIGIRIRIGVRIGVRFGIDVCLRWLCALRRSLALD